MLPWVKRDGLIQKEHLLLHSYHQTLRPNHVIVIRDGPTLFGLSYGVEVCSSKKKRLGLSCLMNQKMQQQVPSVLCPKCCFYNLHYLKSKPARLSENYILFGLHSLEHLERNRKSNWAAGIIRYKKL